MNNEVSMDQLFICLHQSVLDVRGNSTEVARRIGMRHGTLLTKLNPLDDLHLPNLGEFVRIMDATGNTEPLDILCSMFGGRFSTRNTRRGASVVDVLLKTTVETADVVRTAHECMADGVLDDAEKVKIRREIDEARQMLVELENTINAE